MYDSRFRIAGRTSRFIESDYQSGKAQDAFGELSARRLDILVTRRAYTAGPAIAGIAVLLARPTRLSPPFSAFLARLQAPACVLDIALNCARLGVPANWDPELIVGEPADVVVDPMLDRLTVLPTAQLQRWAEGDRGRLELIAKARGYKPGWVEISAKAWLDQVTGRPQPPPSHRQTPKRAQA